MPSTGAKWFNCISYLGFGAQVSKLSFEEPLERTLAHGHVTPNFSAYLFIQTLGQNIVNHINLYTLNFVIPTFLISFLLLYSEILGK